MEKRLKKYLENGRFSDVSDARKKTMSSIKSKGNKTTEVKLRMALIRSRQKGFVMHPKNIMGRPDFYFINEKIAIFVDGCFWHGCPKCGHFPKTRTEFWSAKICRNLQRDKEINDMLLKEGIRVIRIWEHEIKQQTGLNAVLLKIGGKLSNEI